MQLLLPPVFFFLLLPSGAISALTRDIEKCTLWLKTDGSSCQPSSFFSLHKFILGAMPQLTERKICCPDGTGCFSIEKDTPWECYHQLPQCMDKVKPDFMFYTPERSQQVQIIDYSHLNTSCKNLVTSTTIRPFFVIIHGFGKDWPKPWMYNLKDRLIELGNNVLIVRWTGGARDPFYFQSSSNTRTVGAAIAQVVKSLQFGSKISFNSTTIVGFSLGGQICGYVGANLPKLRRIIAIDPAGPMFQCMDPRARLDNTDAQFVQAIHTHGDYFLMGGCGSLQQMGAMDVYINGGTQQAGCSRGTPQGFLDLARLNCKSPHLFCSIAGSAGMQCRSRIFSVTIMVEDVSCSHNRVPPLFIEMVTNAKSPDTDCQYIGFPCTSSQEWLSGGCFECPSNGCPKIGYLTDLGMGHNGKFFVNTLGENSTTGQYCGRQFLVSLTSDATLKGKIQLTFKGAGMQYRPVIFQDTYDVMTPRDEKKIVAVVPWNMTRIDGFDILYTRNKLLLTGGPKSWKLGPVYVKSVEGVRREYLDKIIITDGQLATVQFSPQTDVPQERGRASPIETEETPTLGIEDTPALGTEGTPSPEPPETNNS